MEIIMHDKKEKPFRRHEIFILGLMVGVTASGTVILFYGELIMPKVMASIMVVSLLSASLYYIYHDDKLFKP